MRPGLIVRRRIAPETARVVVARHPVARVFALVCTCTCTALAGALAAERTARAIPVANCVGGRYERHGSGARMPGGRHRLATVSDEARIPNITTLPMRFGAVIKIRIVAPRRR